MSVGIVCGLWAYLEFLFAAAIWQFLQIPEKTGIIVTGGLDIKSRAAMAWRLASEMGKPSEVTEALRNAKTAAEGMLDERKALEKQERTTKSIFKSTVGNCGANRSTCRLDASSS
jgi:hypothetical protein